MTRAKQMEDKRLMTFEELYNRRRAGRLAADDAAEMLGVSTRTFRRRRARFEDEGEEGLHDRRLDRISSDKVPADETMRALELFETEHFDCSARHFHDALVADRGFTRSYDRLRLKLRSSGLVRPAPRRGAHRRKQVDRMVGNDDAARYKGLTLQISENRHRHRYVRVNARVREHPDERLAVFRGPRCIGRYESSGAALPAEA